MSLLNIVCRSSTELGRNPVSKQHVQLEYGDEQADAGRDCRTRLERPISLARKGTGKYSFSLVSRPRAGLIGNLTRLIHTLAICMTIHPLNRVYPLSSLMPYRTLLHNVGHQICCTILYYTVREMTENVSTPRCIWSCMVTHIARVWVNRVRLPILLVVS